MLQNPPRPLPPPVADAGRPAFVVIRPSVLRFGLGLRLIGAACLVGAIWMLIAWVLW